MRLIQLVDYDRPHGGSFLRFLTGVGRASLERGWSSECAFFESAADAPWVDELREAGLVVHLAPEKHRRSDVALARWLRELTPGGSRTVLHSHFTGFDVASALAARGRPDVKAIWHLHGPLSRSPLQLARGAIKLGLIGRAVDLVLCPSQNIVDDAVLRGAPRRRVRFFPSAIDPDESPFATPEERHRAREVLAIEPEETVVLHFGWHWRLKGGELFIRTLAELARSGRRTVLGVERGGGAQYRDLAASLGVAEELFILNPIDDPNEMHRAADIQIASSLREGMAYGVLESLCVGTPVVATDIPGHAFLAEHTDACRVAPHDPVELAAAAIEMLDRDPVRADREARQARAWIVENLSIDRVAGELAELYEDLATGGELRLRW